MYSFVYETKATFQLPFGFANGRVYWKWIIGLILQAIWRQNSHLNRVIGFGQRTDCKANLKYLRLPTLMFKHSNAFMHNMPLQAFWKSRYLSFSLFGLKATLLCCFKLNSKASIRNLALVLLQWSCRQYVFCFEYLID